MKEKNKVNLNFIKERRLQLGLTLLEVAHALGLKNAGNYYKYENGEYQLSAAMLPPLAKILNCKIDDFFYKRDCYFSKERSNHERTRNGV